MYAPGHWGGTEVAETMLAPADDVHAALGPLDVHLALGAPLPPALPCDLPQQQVILVPLVLPEPLELCAGNAVMPCHLALCTEQTTAVWALSFCYHCLTVATFMNKQCRAVVEGTIELE